MIGMMASALSGLQAFGTALDATANNIANSRTPGYLRLVTTFREGAHGGVQAALTRDPSPGAPLPTGGGAVAASGGSNVDLASELVDFRMAARSYTLMSRLLHRGDEILGSLLDTFA